MALATLTKYSLHFTITNITDRRLKLCCEEFYQKFAQWGYGRKPGGGFGRFIAKHWALKLYNGERYHFHINSLAAFARYCMGGGFSNQAFDIVEVPLFDVTPIELENTDTRTPLPHQTATLDFFENQAASSNVVTLRPGGGKSLIMTNYMFKHQCRIVLIIRPMYIKKWEEDLMAQLGLSKKEICIISGTKALENIIALGPEDTRYKAVIISNKTIKSWFTMFETSKHEDFIARFGIEPWQLMQTLGTDIYYVDERHQDFHLNLLLDLHTHCKQVICATGTLIASDAFLSNMMGMMHPPSTRINPDKYKAYTKVFPLLYRFRYPEGIRTVEWGSTTYSHLAFEASMMKQGDVKENYYRMIKDAIEKNWTKNPQGRKEGDRCLVFFSTVEMCKDFVAYLREVYPEYRIEKYTQEDPYENLMESDIAVSTVLSAGTAHDIPQLTVAILTQALSSIQANLQALGRLRELKDKRNPVYVYLACEQFDKHMSYHQDKVELFREKGLFVYDMAYTKLL